MQPASRPPTPQQQQHQQQLGRFQQARWRRVTLDFLQRWENHARCMTFNLGRDRRHANTAIQPPPGLIAGAEESPLLQTCVPPVLASTPTVGHVTQSGVPPLLTTGQGTRQARRVRWHDLEARETLANREAPGAPVMPASDPSCLQIVDQLTDLCSYLEAPAEMWHGQCSGEVTVAFQQVAADVRREERAAAIKYLQLSICHWIGTRELGVPTEAASTTQAP